MTTQKLWDAAKAVLRGKSIAIKSYLQKQETSHINNLTLHLKQSEKTTRMETINKYRNKVNFSKLKKIPQKRDHRQTELRF